MVLIFSQLPQVPEPPASPWAGMTHQWTGWDGSVWDLATGAEGVTLLRDGLEGLHFPRVEKFKSSSRAVPGTRARGWRTAGREAFWLVSIDDRESSAGFVSRAAAFFRSLHPEKAGVWRVGVGGQFRELRLTGVFEDSHSDPVDPVFRGSGQFKVTLEADQPYWVGAPVTRGPWATADPEDFFGAGAPPFTISKAETFGSASIDNPGDVAAYPVWTITGPLSDVEVGIGDVVVDVGFSVADGEVLVIDTDPRNVTATLDGEDVTATLGFQRFAAVEPGESVPVHVEGTGGGSVSCSLVPLYFRAY